VTPVAIFDDTRADWKARPPTRPNTTVPHKARTRRVWHWAGTPTHLAGKPHTACLAMVRSWQAYHQNTHGWKDIGYNALVCVHGRAIEGRGLAASGSHSPSWNTTGWGIQYMVGTGEQVTAPMFARGARLAADLERLAGHKLDDNPHKADPKATTWVRVGGPTPPPPPRPGSDPMPTVNEIWTTPLTKKGTIGGADTNESPLDILCRVARNVEAIAVLVRDPSAAVQSQQGGDPG
jgi:hypothetical protein